MLEFYSIDSEGNEIQYLSAYERQDNTFIFDDKTVEATCVLFEFGKEFRIKRQGKITMNFLFDLDKNTVGIYENEMGLSIKFVIKTKEIIYKNNSFSISYDLYLDGDLISEHTIKIRILD